MGSVGYAGWCTYGGYGPWANLYGLGVDQIIGARLVDGNGRMTDADDELLEGIRGAGPTFGVIVELIIKVYPLREVSAQALGLDCCPPGN